MDEHTHIQVEALSEQIEDLKERLYLYRRLAFDLSGTLNDVFEAIDDETAEMLREKLDNPTKS